MLLASAAAPIALMMANVPATAGAITSSEESVPPSPEAGAPRTVKDAEKEADDIAVQAALDAMAKAATWGTSSPDVDLPSPDEKNEAAADPDPFQPLNRVFYAISQPIDFLVLRPAALLYNGIVPKPLRDGVHNALANIFVPTVLANDLLQLRPRRAARTLARFVINSTLGIGGLVDVARRKPFRIPGHANSLADTLGYAGVEPGFYLYLPVLGPTTFRDVLGMVGDAFTQPLLLNRVYHQQVTTVNKRKRTFFTSTFAVSNEGLVTLILGGIDARGRAEPALQALKAQSVDPYAALRSSYLQDRAGEIAELRRKDGEPTRSTELDDPLDDPAMPAKPSAAQPPATEPAR